MPLGTSRPVDARPPRDVSVVMPVYNHERYVGPALTSVLGQTVRTREIICIDDGSTDGSARVVEAIAREHAEVRCWSRPNRGAHATLNEAIAASTGRNVAILNSDDLFHPGRLARCLAVLEARPEVDVVCTGIAFVDAQGRPVANAWYEEARAFHDEVKDLGLALVNGNFLMTTSNVVARRAVFDELGGFDDLRYAHDLDFFLRLVAGGKRVALLARPLLRYRIHGANTISEAPGGVRIEWAAVSGVFAARVRAGAEPRCAGPEYERRLRQITERHGLSAAVSIIVERLERGAGDAPTPGALLADVALRSVLQESLR